MACWLIWEYHPCDATTDYSTLVIISYGVPKSSAVRTITYSTSFPCCRSLVIAHLFFILLRVLYWSWATQKYEVPVKERKLRRGGKAPSHDDDQKARRIKEKKKENHCRTWRHEAHHHTTDTGVLRIQSADTRLRQRIPKHAVTIIYATSSSDTKVFGSAILDLKGAAR